MKNRLQILGEAEQLAYKVIGGVSYLGDKLLAAFRDGDLTDQEIIAKLAGEFLMNAANCYNEDDYDEEQKLLN